MKTVCLIVVLHFVFAGGSDVVCESDSCRFDHADQPGSNSTRLLQMKGNVLLQMNGLLQMKGHAKMDEDDELLDIVDEADDQKDSKKDINFRLYDLSDDSNYEEFAYDKLQEIEVSPNKPTKISIHGWGGGFDIDHMFADAYFSADEDVNLIGVDWRPLTDTPNVQVKIAGEAVADMIADLIDRDLTTLDDIHLICFSWGCQVSGWASWYLREKDIGLIPRLTATDPGKNQFAGNPAKERISKDDAQLVDVIHSNTGGLGWQWPVGHVDFYPNGGDGLFKGSKSDSDNHKIAPVFFAQSIKNHEAYPANRCEGDAHDAKTWEQYSKKNSGVLNPKNCQMDEKKVYMGEGLDVKAQHGFYYLKASTDGYEAALEKYVNAKKPAPKPDPKPAPKPAPKPEPKPAPKPQPAPGPAPPGELELIGKGKSCPGKPEGGWDGFGKKLTEEECKDKCLADADCVAVLWDQKHGKCGGWKTCSKVVDKKKWSKKFLFKKV